MNAQQILKYHNESGGHGTLLVDDVPGVEGSGIARLSEMGLSAHSLWMDDHFLRDVRTAVVSKGRTAFDLYRALENLERFVVPGGAILVLPYGSDAPENRFEATEIFLGVHREWSRSLVNENTVELKKELDKDDARKILTKEQINGLAAPAVAASKRVVGLALFGCGGFWDTVGCYVRAHHSLFPGYELRIHHDDSIDKMPYGKVLRAMETRRLVKLVHMAPDGLAIGKTRSMLWRLAPAWDPSVEYVFARDLDSLPMWEERCIVEEFISSNKDLSTIHNAGAHAGIMGGLCGFRAAALRAFSPTFEAFIESAGFTAEQWQSHGSDQNFLNGAVRPYMTGLGHSIAVSHNRAAAMGPIPYVTEIAPPSEKVIASVPEEVRKHADELAPYMGSAGYPLTAALAFYNEHGARVDEIKSAEAEAGL